MQDVGLACVYVWYTLEATLLMLNAPERFTMGCRHQGLTKCYSKACCSHIHSLPFLLLYYTCPVSTTNIRTSFIC